MALVFYELCTNAANYGVLSQADGGLLVVARRQGDRFLIAWRERCRLDPHTTQKEGFGTQMCESVVKATLGGAVTRQLEASGMTATMDLDLKILEANSPHTA